MGLNITRRASLSRHTAPSFVMASGLELLQLRKLPHLAYRLYIELLAMADHATGRISTSYAVLLALVDFDAVDCRNADDKPTLKRVRTAVEALVSLGLVRVDRVKNEKTKGLFFRVSSRAGISAPGEPLGRPKGRHREAKKPANTGPTAPQGENLGQTLGQGVQELKTPPISPSYAHPEGGDPIQPARALRDALKARAAGGKIKAPQGGQTVAPAGHTPPGASPPGSPLGDPSPRGTAINSPPRGGSRPPGTAAAVGDLLAGLRARGG